jgi:transcriptional regulator with XRE-family HTH domain
MLRFVLAANVAARMVSVFHDQPNKTAREKKLAQAAGVSVSTVGRILNGDTGASLDNIEHVARALGCSAVSLLTPDETMKQSLGL